MRLAADDKDKDADDDSIPRRRPPPITIRYRVTGAAAHRRIVPLLPGDWIDASSSPSSNGDDDGGQQVFDFLWENAPRLETRPYRDRARCYSHLPNGTAVLDCKWALARLFDEREGEDCGEDCGDGDRRSVNGKVRSSSTTSSSSSAISTTAVGLLETHCFRGRSGLRSLLATLWRKNEASDDGDNCASSGGGSSGGGSDDRRRRCVVAFADLKAASDDEVHTGVVVDDATRVVPRKNPNLWVVKDASSNGAGGIWVADAGRGRYLANSPDSPLVEGHRYVAQRYAWPLVLYGGRKCHVRAYGLLTSDGRAFVHDRAFLHVANEPFTIRNSDSGGGDGIDGDPLLDVVHITNCCANSHDGRKFAGEICARLDRTERGGGDSSWVPLGRFAPAIRATVAAFAERSLPFVQGGQANRGFEYLGLDFILSYDETSGKPTAYLLEVNAPPSQDTATGLRHAEDVHNAVIADLISLWVVPKVLGSSAAEEKPGGWRCVYRDQTSTIVKDHDLLTPSKAAILNKMRWALFEQKKMKINAAEKMLCRLNPAFEQDELSKLSFKIRSMFPFFQNHETVFFENAGGSQVPYTVKDNIGASIQHRYRAVKGTKSKDEARKTLHTVLGANETDYAVHLGANATTLLALLANEYVRCGALQPGDEIIISAENHLANTTPWLDAAQAVGATVKWWYSSGCNDIETLEALLTKKTRVVAAVHVSNILGLERNIRKLCRVVHQVTASRAHVVVDGVAAAPHMFAAVDDAGPDWYAVSCHKLFGPHLGVLCGKKAPFSTPFRLELGTVNYEACAGIVGFGQYLAYISELASTSAHVSHSSPEDADCSCSTPVLDRTAVQRAYKLFGAIEAPLFTTLRSIIANCRKARMIEAERSDEKARKLPIICFVHQELSSSQIAQACVKAGIACRNGTFLSCEYFQLQHRIDPSEGVVRFSLAHYNTPSEVNRLKHVLESIPGWF